VLGCFWLEISFLLLGLRSFPAVSERNPEQISSSIHILDEKLQTALTLERSKRV